MSDEEDFVFWIADVEEAPGAPLASDPELERQAHLPAFMRRATEVAISPKQLDDFWREKVLRLARTISTAQSKDAAAGFRVEEITFSLGVGAKGGVFFVAEGSVEATMSVKLRRSGAAPPASPGFIVDP